MSRIVLKFAISELILAVIARKVNLPLSTVRIVQMYEYTVRDIDVIDKKVYLYCDEPLFQNYSLGKTLSVEKVPISKNHEKSEILMGKSSGKPVFEKNRLSAVVS